MALKSIEPSLLLMIVIVATTSMIVAAGDPDSLKDFIVPVNNSLPVDGNFFTFTGMRNVFFHFPPTFNITKASMAEFPALDGQSVSLAVLQFPPRSVNPPHTHPRASELLFLIGGELQVGFIDTKNVLYTQTLRPGDMFVFPEGLIHFQYNALMIPANAISAFGSASAGTVSMPKTVFATGIDDNILAEAFQTDLTTIEKIKQGLTMP